MEWVWDERKATVNYRKHRVRFETAMLVFDDPMFLSVPDPHPDDDRWRTIGVVGSSALFVVHTVIDENGVGRIISARRATPMERGKESV
ncbi:MAG: BrnT family toxin [Sphingomonas sp.]